MVLIVIVMGPSTRAVRRVTALLHQKPVTALITTAMGTSMKAFAGLAAVLNRMLKRSAGMDWMTTVMVVLKRGC